MHAPGLALLNVLWLAVLVSHWRRSRGILRLMIAVLIGLWLL